MNLQSTPIAQPSSVCSLPHVNWWQFRPPVVSTVISFPNIFPLSCAWPLVFLLFFEFANKFPHFLGPFPICCLPENIAHISHSQSLPSFQVLLKCHLFKWDLPQVPYLQFTAFSVQLPCSAFSVSLTLLLHTIQFTCVLLKQGAAKRRAPRRDL